MASLMLSKSAFVSGRVATKSVRASPRAAVVARAANRPTWYAVFVEDASSVFAK